MIQILQALENYSQGKSTWMSFGGRGFPLGPRPYESMYFFRSVSMYSNTKYSIGFSFFATCSTQRSLHTYTTESTCSSQILFAISTKQRSLLLIQPPETAEAVPYDNQGYIWYRAGLATILQLPITDEKFNDKD